MYEIAPSITETEGKVKEKHRGAVYLPQEAHKTDLLL